MHFMNEPEIDTYVHRYREHRVLAEATRFLSDLRHLVNENSDGWCYWRAPVVAAKQLMLLIEKPETATTAALKKALVPIKSFCTRKKLKCPRLPGEPIPAATQTADSR